MQDHLPGCGTSHGGVGTSHRGIGPPTLIINEEMASQDCLYASLVEDFLNGSFLFSGDPGCVYQASGDLHLSASGTSDFCPSLRAQPIRGQHRPFLHHGFTEGKGRGLTLYGACPSQGTCCWFQGWLASSTGPPKTTQLREKGSSVRKYFPKLPKGKGLKLVVAVKQVSMGLGYRHSPLPVYLATC